MAIPTTVNPLLMYVASVSRLRRSGFMVGKEGWSFSSFLYSPSPHSIHIQRTFTFWRFLIKVPLAQHEMMITYSINHGQKIEFWVPGRMQNMRWAAHSVRTSFFSFLRSWSLIHHQCNGFSAGVNQDDFRGPGFQSGYDPVWIDLLSKHSETPFHLLMGGGDQLYCDACAFHMSSIYSI